MSILRPTLILSCALVTACGPKMPTMPMEGSTPVAAADVHATSAVQFAPATVTLTAGGTVTFDFESLPHNVFFDGSPAGAPANITEASSNVRVTRTFDAPGRFTYNCHLHPGMTGVVIVQ